MVITDDMNWIYNYDPERKQQSSQGKPTLTETKKCEIVDMKGIVHKEFILAGQIVLHVAVTLYGNCVPMCEDFIPTSGDKRTGYSIMTVHHLTLPFHQGICHQMQHDCHPPPTVLT
jgi:hypothetical protein